MVPLTDSEWAGRVRRLLPCPSPPLLLLLYSYSDCFYYTCCSGYYYYYCYCCCYYYCYYCYYDDRRPLRRLAKPETRHTAGSTPSLRSIRCTTGKFRLH